MKERNENSISNQQPKLINSQHELVAGLLAGKKVFSFFSFFVRKMRHVTSCLRLQQIMSSFDEKTLRKQEEGVLQFQHVSLSYMLRG